MWVLPSKRPRPAGSLIRFFRRGQSHLLRIARRCVEAKMRVGRTGEHAAALGEARDAIEEVVEPYLMQQGFVQRTPRGRMLTGAAYAHLGLSAPPRDPQQMGLFATEDPDE